MSAGEVAAPFACMYLQEAAKPKKGATKMKSLELTRFGAIC